MDPGTIGAAKLLRFKEEFASRNSIRKMRSLKRDTALVIPQLFVKLSVRAWTPSILQYLAKNIC